MIISSTLLTRHPVRHTATVCIVGGGAAGITLAYELGLSGIDVLLLEAGGLRAERSANDMHEGFTEVPHPATASFRRVRFGGTTNIWGGRCVPLDPIDFTARAHVPHSGWPLAYADLAPYYARALVYCDAGANEFSLQEALPGARPTLPGASANPVLTSDRIERYSLPTDFGKKYRRQLAQLSNVTVVLHARCVAIVKDDHANRVEGVQIVDREGTQLLVKARYVVLAAGGIEVPRLLLASNPDGVALGNRFDLVGRYYNCHFENTCGRVTAPQGRIPFAFERTRDGVYCRRKLQFSAAAQRRFGLLNTAFRFHFPNYADPGHGSAVMSGIYLAKRLLVPEHRAILQHQQQTPVASTGFYRQHLRNVTNDLPGLLAFGGQWLVKRQLARRKLPYTLVPNQDASYPLEFNCEQVPLPGNRVELDRDGRCDRHGMPRVVVRWRLSNEDVEAAQRGFEVLRMAMARHSQCRLHFDPDLLRDQLSRSVPLGGHHMGTTRMADDARHGVVDRHCAVHGLPNLFVASAAVFPTSGHANPTLTIVALAIRIADHLRHQLDRPSFPMEKRLESGHLDMHVM